MADWTVKIMPQTHISTVLKIMQAYRVCVCLQILETITSEQRQQNCQMKSVMFYDLNYFNHKESLSKASFSRASASEHQNRLGLPCSFYIHAQQRPVCGCAATEQRTENRAPQPQPDTESLCLATLSITCVLWSLVINDPPERSDLKAHRPIGLCVTWRLHKGQRPHRSTFRMSPASIVWQCEHRIDNVGEI